MVEEDLDKLARTAKPNKARPLFDFWGFPNFMTHDFGEENVQNSSRT